MATVMPNEGISFSSSADAAARAGEDLPTDWSEATPRDELTSARTVHPRDIPAGEPAPGLGPGAVLRNRFVLQAALEPSGMSQVYRALDRRRQEAGAADALVAVKVAGPGTPRATEAIRILQQEATIAQRLEHPHIVRVYDFDRDGDFGFITMEWLEGESLAALLNRHRSRPLELAQALQVIREIGSALDYAHRQGVTHADVKPGNIFIARFGSAKLLDFGTARSRLLAPDGAEITEARTPAYASCEVLEGEVPQAADDVYSLACVAYRLLAGHRAFGHQDALAAERGGRRPSPLRGLPAQQWQALERALAFRRQARTPDVATFLAAFDAAALTAVRDGAVPAAQAERAPLITTAALGGAIGALLVGVAAALLWPDTPTSPPADTAPPPPPREVSMSDLKLTRYVEPTMRGRSRDLVGWVHLRFTVDRDGVPRDIAVVDASALGVHEESAMAAVRRWRFAPVREGGQPVERRTAVRLRFETGK
jgi:TonB family protein